MVDIDVSATKVGFRSESVVVSGAYIVSDIGQERGGQHLYEA